MEISIQSRYHFLLQTSLTALFADFARQRSDGYVSSQEPTNRLRRTAFRKRKDTQDGC